MGFTRKYLYVALSLVSLVLGSDVLEFDTANFNAKIRDYSVGLVQFYSPRCGYCQRLSAKYEEAATALKHNEPPIVFAKGKD